MPLTTRIVKMKRISRWKKGMKEKLLKDEDLNLKMMIWAMRMTMIHLGKCAVQP